MLKLKWRGYPMQVILAFILLMGTLLVQVLAFVYDATLCYLITCKSITYIGYIHTHTHIKVMHLMCLVLNPRPQPPPRTCKVKRCRKKKITSFMYFSICIINIYMLDCWPVGYLWKEVFLQAFNISKQFLHWHRVHMDKINLRIYFLIHCI